jgi:lipoyl-dependent peroxiredoxin
MRFRIYRQQICGGFEDQSTRGMPGTNSEELIAAAHAGCFTMALSLILSEAKLTAELMETSAKVTLEQVEGGYASTAVHLTLKAKIPGADQASFEKLSSVAKAGCPSPSC